MYEDRVSTETALVILMRPRPAGFEVFALRRQGVAFGFPGGPIHPNEDARVAAARVLFEDCGVLIGRDSGEGAETLEMPSLPTLRKKIAAGANATEVLRGAGLTWASEALFPWAHWMSPSSSDPHRRSVSAPGIQIDGGESSTRLFVAELPPGMQPRFSRDEAVESMWLLASDAELRADELLLAPHAIRTCWELRHFDKLVDVFAAARARASEPHPILPRLGPNFSLLLPWDPEYAAAGQGASLPFAYHPKWAQGPSRFVREDRTWKLVGAPGSKTAG